MAGDMGLIPDVTAWASRLDERSTRDFTVTLAGVGDIDGDVKTTFGENVVLEMKTPTHPEGWFLRMPEGEHILSARFGMDGVEILWIPVDALRRL
ncbi:hypothetical protein [Deinococcus multiflagellatus]|uniref:Uncharacterized protein n=1 Tax=Deinococcus multiflagellatus TaxID=1656887 RepID=A0ABW1ZR30_9DEIO|nr:hypothetical protein [Deinococcus multiflagellatus]MBZ9715235.1 hypothetical protein [Deinococcus multiflagellatus]